MEILPLSLLDNTSHLNTKLSKHENGNTFVCSIAQVKTPEKTLLYEKIPKGSLHILTDIDFSICQTYIWTIQTKK